MEVLLDGPAEETLERREETDKDMRGERQEETV